MSLISHKGGSMKRKQLIQIRRKRKKLKTQLLPRRSQSRMKMKKLMISLSKFLKRRKLQEARARLRTRRKCLLKEILLSPQRNKRRVHNLRKNISMNSSTMIAMAMQNL
jgi:hypothetical protein